MVLGIVCLAGTLVCGLALFCAPFALWVGLKASREMKAEPGRWSGHGQATAGWVCGLVGTVLLAVALVTVVLVLAVASAGGT